MKTEEIIEGNKLIAEFMGLHWSIRHDELVYADWDGMRPIKYRSSWDALMPVVRKINDIYDDVNTDPLDKGFEVVDLGITTSIEYAWETIVRFIKKYNKIKKPTQ